MKFHNITIIAASSLAHKIKAISEKLNFIDEDRLLRREDGGYFTLADARKIMPQGAGWYFQQFLKLGFAKYRREVALEFPHAVGEKSVESKDQSIQNFKFDSTQSGFYLSFDSDSLLVAPLIIDLKRPFINTTPSRLPKDHPYEVTNRALLNLEPPNVTFMCEYMLAI